jgi:hypothetical protein
MRLPARADIDPLDLRRMLPALLLVDVVGPESRLRYRLVGTGIVERLGVDLTGQYLDEATGGPLLDLETELYHVVIDRRSPVYCETLLRPDGTFGLSTNCRLLLPLAGDGKTVDMVLAAHAEVKLPRSGCVPPTWSAFPESVVCIEAEGSRSEWSIDG